MFPYPSGAGLHVGHPEGYTATDILSRVQTSAGIACFCNPDGMGCFWVAGGNSMRFGPSNIRARRRKKTSQPLSARLSHLDSVTTGRARSTRPIRNTSNGRSGFLKLYNSWFNPETNKAEPIETLPTKDRAVRDSKRLAYVSEAPVWVVRTIGYGARQRMKSSTAKAKSAASPSFASRCANGCCGSLPRRNVCSVISTPSSGVIH